MTNNAHSVQNPVFWMRALAAQSKQTHQKIIRVCETVFGITEFQAIEISTAMWYFSGNTLMNLLRKILGISRQL